MPFVGIRPRSCTPPRGGCAPRETGPRCSPAPLSSCTRPSPRSARPARPSSPCIRCRPCLLVLWSAGRVGGVQAEGCGGGFCHRTWNASFQLFSEPPHCVAAPPSPPTAAARHATLHQPSPREKGRALEKGMFGETTDLSDHDRPQARLYGQARPKPPRVRVRWCTKMGRCLLLPVHRPRTTRSAGGWRGPNAQHRVNRRIKSLTTSRHHVEGRGMASMPWLHRTSSHWAKSVMFVMLHGNDSDLRHVCSDGVT